MDALGDLAGGGDEEGVAGDIGGRQPAAALYCAHLKELPMLGMLHGTPLQRIVARYDQAFCAVFHQSPRYVGIVHVEADADAECAERGREDMGVRTGDAVLDKMHRMVFYVLPDEVSRRIEEKRRVAEVRVLFGIEFVFRAEEEVAAVLSGRLAELMPELGVGAWVADETVLRPDGQPNGGARRKLREAEQTLIVLRICLDQPYLEGAGRIGGGKDVGIRHE